MNLGYKKPLFILPFDHRASFLEKYFNQKGEATPEEAKLVSEFKDTIFEALLLAVKGHIPRDQAAVLVDEQFGRHVLEQAKEQKIVRILTVEKSGLQEFDFEYGAQYKDHLLEFRPEFAKALLRYNPDGDQEHNSHSRARLKELSDFCHSENIRLLVEPLVPPTPDQLMQVDGDKTRYDEELRGILTVRLMAEMYDAGIEVDVWKVEGFTSETNYQLITLQAHVGGRTDTGVVVLGRAETTEKVTEWIRAGSHVPGVIGFAVGRTIFWDPLAKLKSGEIDHQAAVKEMADRYQHFYQVFKGKR